MNKDRTTEELVAIWLTLNEEAKHDFIEEKATAREVYRLDQAGYLNWESVKEE